MLYFQNRTLQEVWMINGVKRTKGCRAAAAVLFFAALAGNAQNRMMIRLKEDPFTIEENKELYQWADLATNMQGHLYLTDMIDNTIKWFDSHGNLMKKAGGRGHAPGTFQGICQIRFRDGRLYVTDRQRSGIQVFSTNLEYVGQIPFSSPVIDFELQPDHSLLVLPMAMTERGSIVHMNQTGEEMDRFEYSHRHIPPVQDLASFCQTPDSQFVLAFKFTDRIEKMSFNQGLIWCTSMKLHVKQSFKIIFGIQVPGKVVYKDVSVDSLGNLYILGGHFSKNQGRDIYVLSPGGALLTILTLQEPSHCIHIDCRDRLYARSKAGSAVARYQIVHE